MPSSDTLLAIESMAEKLKEHLVLLVFTVIVLAIALYFHPKKR